MWLMSLLFILGILFICCCGAGVWLLPADVFLHHCTIYRHSPHGGEKRICILSKNDVLKKKKNVWTSLFPFSWLTWTAACQLKQVCLHPSQAPCVHVRYPLHRDPLRIQSLCRHQPLETWGSPRGCVWCTSWLARAWLSASSWWEDKFRTDCKCFCALCCHLSSTVSF